MKTKISILLFLSLSLMTIAQSKVTMKLTNPEGYEWAILYKVIDGQQEFIQNTELKDSLYVFNLDKKATKGIYRVAYTMSQSGVIDFIYDGGNLNFSIDPENAFETISFKDSKENILFQAYKRAILEEQTKLDQLQVAYFSAESLDEKKDLEDEYTTDYQKLEAKQKSYEIQAKHTFALHLIKSSRRYFNPTLYTDQESFLAEFKKHYFDYVDFSDLELNKSSLLIDKAIEYVFYLNSSEDTEKQDEIYTNSVKEVFLKIGENKTAKVYITTSLLYAFAQLENYTLLKFLLNDYYKKLPSEDININIVTEMEAKLKTTIGGLAPNITWEVDGKENSLEQLAAETNYLIVFWSTTCSHCLNEVPVLYDKTKNKKNLKVIAVALEDDTVDYSIYAAKFQKWINVYGAGKWENQFADAYAINATPTYFILNSKKEIVAKPDSYKDVLKFLKIQE